MSAYRFEAADAGGRMHAGVLDADSPRLARAVLRERGLTPVSVDSLDSLDAFDSRDSLDPRGSRSDGDPAFAPSTSSGVANGLGAAGLSPAVRPSVRRLRTPERALLMRQLASLIEAGLPLAQALAAVREQAERPAVRELLGALRSDVLAGHALAAALARHPGSFPQLDCALVAAGEQTGELGGVLARLADQIERRAALAARVQLAFAYPAIVALVAFLVIGVLLTYVVPQVVGVFDQTRQTLPWLTRALIWLSDGLRQWGWLLVIVLIIALFGMRAALRRPEARLRWHEFLLGLPLAGGLLLRIDLARFADTLAILAGAGVPILAALKAARDTVSNEVLRAEVDEAISRVREGSSLATALGLGRMHAGGSATRFPPVMLNLIASGEATGRLPDLLQRAAAIQNNEFERRTLLLTSLLEPALVLIMGGVVLLIVLAILMPIVEVNQLIR